MKLKCNSLVEIVADVEGISMQEASEKPIIEKMNKYMFKYIDMKITKAFGKNTIIGYSEGGLMLDIDIHETINVGENGDEWIETPLP